MILSLQTHPNNFAHSWVSHPCSTVYDLMTNGRMFRIGRPLKCDCSVTNIEYARRRVADGFDSRSKPKEVESCT